MRRPSYLKQRRRLDSIVTFQRRTNAKDGFNAPTKDGWADVFETRCAVYPAPGFERFANAQNAATAPVMIEVRSEPRTLDLKAKDRLIIHGPDGLKESGTTYNIVSPNEQLERGSNIRITAAVDT